MNKNVTNELKEFIDENTKEETGLILLAVTDSETDLCISNASVANLANGIFALIQDFKERTDAEDVERLLEIINSIYGDEVTPDVCN